VRPGELGGLRGLGGLGEPGGLGGAFGALGALGDGAMVTLGAVVVVEDEAAERRVELAMPGEGGGERAACCHSKEPEVPEEAAFAIAIHN